MVRFERRKTIGDIQAARRFNPEVRANLDGYSDEEILASVLSIANGDNRAEAAEVEDPRIAEFKLLANGSRSWNRTSRRRFGASPAMASVHRLREVACLYGFTRFEPAPLANEDLEDVGLAVNGAALGQNPEWLPAVEQFGEGFFIRFSSEALAQWLVRPAVLERAQQLQAGATAWIEAKRARGMAVSANVLNERERPEYIMAHSLAHALMTEVAIDCGYPASALKERIYLLPRLPGQPIQCGILIYTASAGNQGTLGGLVEITHRFAKVLKSALERERLCSGDPVCADHDPVTADDDRMLHGAACHGCLLISETSCEARNVLLDRVLLVDTVGPTGAAYF